MTKEGSRDSEVLRNHLKGLSKMCICWLHSKQTQLEALRVWPQESALLSSQS